MTIQAKKGKYFQTELTPWSTVLEMLTVPQLLKTIPGFYESGSLISVFKRVVH
jgi:hypothetical protein